jgi:hypothetical protein
MGDQVQQLGNFGLEGMGVFCHGRTVSKNKLHLYMRMGWVKSSQIRRLIAIWLKNTKNSKNAETYIFCLFFNQISWFHRVLINYIK